jgi:4-azaleucine resistance transporter AzlC
VAPTLADGARRIAPIGVAVAGFGIAFGILAGTAGMPPAATVTMSATTFAGSGQFAAVSVLDSAGATAVAILAAVLLNVRYLPIGISAAPAFEGGLPRRLLEAQLVVDESWALAHVGGGRYDRRLILGGGLVLYAAWVGGTVIGALGAGWLGDPERLGLDAAFPALFLTLLHGQGIGRDRRALAAALLGAGIALVLVPFTPPGIPLGAASLACLVGWSR